MCEGWERTAAVIPILRDPGGASHPSEDKKVSDLAVISMLQGLTVCGSQSGSVDRKPTSQLNGLPPSDRTR